MSAIISKCRRYRYRLDRQLDCSGTKVIAFFGINPSTADDSIDDPTIRKMKGFASRQDGRSIIVGNVFAFRTPHVHELELVLDPIGPENRQHLEQIISEADILIPCWGGRKKVPSLLWTYFDEMLELLQLSGKPVHCLGKTMSGDPKHPLFVPYSTLLVRL